MAYPRRQSYEIDMCSGPILGKLLQFALPLMLSSMLQLLFNAADIVVVGRFAGDNSLAAVGSTSSIVQLLCNLFIGLSVGANILASRFYGAGDREAMRQTVHTSILLSLISGILLAVAGFFSARGILSLMQSPPEVIDLAALYLKIYFLGMPANMLYNFGAALLRAVGDTKRPLLFLSAAGIINVALNLLFVIVFHLDVAGVALATIISETVSAALVVRCMMKEDGACHLELRQLHLWRIRVKQILQTGLPAGLQNIMFSLANVAIQSTINSFGPIVVAGNAAAENIEAFVYAASNACYQASLCFTSQNLGAGRLERIPKILIRSQICAALSCTVLGCTAYLFGTQLLGIYTDSPAVISAGLAHMVIISVAYGICGLMDATVGCLRGIGYSVLPMLTALFGVCGLRLAIVFALFRFPRFHVIQTVFWAYPVSWTVTFLAHLLFFPICFRRVKRHYET